MRYAFFHLFVFALLMLLTWKPSVDVPSYAAIAAAITATSSVSSANSSSSTTGAVGTGAAAGAGAVRGVFGTACNPRLLRAG